MKIISKFKDFYDFNVSKYGMDEKLVYSRVTSEFSSYPKGDFSTGRGSNGYRHKLLLVGDKTVHLFFNEKRIYSHLELKNIDNLKEGRSLNFYNRLRFNYGEPKLLFNDGTVIPLKDDDNIYIEPFGSMLYEMVSMNRRTFVNHFRKEILGYYSMQPFFDEGQSERLEIEKMENEPMVMIEYLDFIRDHSARSNYSVYKCTYNPNLQKLGIYLDPDFVWQSLVDFLSRKRSEKEVMPEFSDDIKIQQHGFDLKTSFRPKMKKK